jgi:hypothetical protein
MTMRKRGAQAGNTNALKHGFYSRYFRTIDINDLDELELKLEDEIAAARLAGRRMLELLDEMHDPQQSLHALSAFSLHLIHIATLIRTHAILSGNNSDTSTAISKAIEDIARELNLL